ncbi:hypothetical protein [Equine adenovirus 1]|uniref:Uncharacterized protein n=1 Tax=Equine adenovirus A serotype 1 TaxID=46916 RepID=A0A1B0XB94_ADEE1|nr:hypothetical protein [Equine adenovirus 1]
MLFDALLTFFLHEAVSPGREEEAVGVPVDRFEGSALERRARVLGVKELGPLRDEGSGPREDE